MSTAGVIDEAVPVLNTAVLGAHRSRVVLAGLLRRAGLINRDGAKWLVEWQFNKRNEELAQQFQDADEQEEVEAAPVSLSLGCGGLLEGVFVPLGAARGVYFAIPAMTSMKVPMRALGISECVTIIVEPGDSLEQVRRWLLWANGLFVRTALVCFVFNGDDTDAKSMDGASRSHIHSIRSEFMSMRKTIESLRPMLSHIVYLTSIPLMRDSFRVAAPEFHPAAIDTFRQFLSDSARIVSKGLEEDSRDDVTRCGVLRSRFTCCSHAWRVVVKVFSGTFKHEQWQTETLESFCTQTHDAGSGSIVGIDSGSGSRPLISSTLGRPKFPVRSWYLANVIITERKMCRPSISSVFAGHTSTAMDITTIWSEQTTWPEEMDVHARFLERGTKATVLLVRTKGDPFVLYRRCRRLGSIVLSQNRRMWGHGRVVASNCDPLPPWGPQVHIHYPQEFQCAVEALLLSLRHSPMCFPMVPLELLTMVCRAACPRDLNDMLSPCHRWIVGARPPSWLLDTVTQ